MVTAAAAAFLALCGKQAGGPVSSGATEGDILTMAIAAADENSLAPHGGLYSGIVSIVDLSADQKQKIKAVVGKFRPSHRRDVDGQRPSREQWMAMRDSIKNEIESILTSDQKALLDQVRAELKAGVVPDTLVKKLDERLASLLTLTPDQQTQAFTILKQAMQKRLAARAKDSSFVRDSGQAWGHRHGPANGPNGSFGLPAEFLNILTDVQKQLLRQKTSWRERNDSARYEKR
jgi:hypothetical protein